MLRGKADKVQDEVFIEIRNDVSIVTDNWKMSVDTGPWFPTAYPIRKGALYDRKADPHQLTNRYYDEDYAAKREELDTLTDEWLARFEDPFLNGYELIKVLGFASPKLAGKGRTGRLPGRPIDILTLRRGE